MYPKLLRHSQRLQQIARKQHFENTRQVGTLSGYQYWQWADAPPDPHMDSLDEGVVDYFHRPTKTVTAEEVAQTQGATALLTPCDLHDRTFWADRGRRVPLVVSHFGHAPLTQPITHWRLVHDEETLADGTIHANPLAIGELGPIGAATIPPLGLAESAKTRLIVELSDPSGQRSDNEWALWAFVRNDLDANDKRVASWIGCYPLAHIYPFVRPADDLSAELDLVICSKLDGPVFAYLRAGGAVLWLAGSDQFDEQLHTQFFARALAARGTMIEDHPAVAGFPHDGYCDTQFYNLMQSSSAVPIPADSNMRMLGAKASEYDRTGPAGRANTMTPIIWGVQSTGSWTQRERQLQAVAWLVEARVGQGRLLLCTLDVLGRAGADSPEAVCLLDALLVYALSDAFAPQGSIPTEELSGMFMCYSSS